MSEILPRIWCDFNAQGWSGEQDDTCYYVFDQTDLKEANPFPGKRVFLFDFENEEKTAIVGCEATLETFKDKWRARPDEETWRNEP